MNKVIQNLENLGLSLPKPTAVAGNYVPYLETGGLLSVSGQTCKVDGQLAYSGALDNEMAIDIGVKAAQICALNILAQVDSACDGNWERIKACIKITVFVNSSADFIDQPTVANGASDLLVKILGDKGLHTRSAVGVSTLPGGSMVEIDGLFEILPKLI